MVIKIKIIYCILICRHINWLKFVWKTKQFESYIIFIINEKIILFAKISPQQKFILLLYYAFFFRQ